LLTEIAESWICGLTAGQFADSSDNSLSVPPPHDDRWRVAEAAVNNHWCIRCSGVGNAANRPLLFEMDL
jgi:hypothetical protein